MLNGNVKRAFRCLVVLATAGGLTACETPTADSAAGEALTQLATYEREINRKTAAEEAYYDTVQKNTVARIIGSGLVNQDGNPVVDDAGHPVWLPGLWQNQHLWKFEQAAKKFAAANANATAAKMTKALPAYVKKQEDDWAKREAGYQKLLADTRKALASGRKKLMVSKEEIGKLRNRLRALVGGKDRKAAVDFVAAYVRAVIDAYEEQAKTTDK